MLILNCPWCGPRAESEFVCGGAGVSRPVDSANLSDQAWGEYLFVRDNIKGLQSEQWCHQMGCGQWFNVRRDTLSYQIKSCDKIGKLPAIDGDPTGETT